MVLTHKYTDITEWFLSTIKTLLQKQETVTIALPGGHSLDGWYALIIADENVWRGIDISRLRWCLVDERCVTAESSDRNDTYVWEVFLKPLGFVPEQFLCLGASEVDALEYTETIGTPDIAIFGLGPDGHIASLFPNHPALRAQVEGYISVSDSPKPPSQRVSLSPMSVSKIPHTALFVVGNEKKIAFEVSLDLQKTIDECPSKLLHPDIIFQQ